MSITIDNLTFDKSSYDKHADVLYLHRGEPREAADSEGTPEGHVVRFDEHGRIIGLTIVNASWLLKRDGKLQITLPHHVELSEATLGPMLVVAA
jgi:uncharacterized protein YuzE